MTHLEPQSLIMSPSATLGQPWVRRNEDGTVSLFFNAECNGFITLVSREHARLLIEAAIDAERQFVIAEQGASMAVVQGVRAAAGELRPLPTGYAAPPLSVAAPVTPANPPADPPAGAATSTLSADTFIYADTFICRYCTFGNHEDCDQKTVVACSCRLAGHPDEEDDADGAFGEAQDWPEDEDTP